MICVSIMLAMLQIWPMVFGKDSLPTAAMAANLLHRATASAPRPKLAYNEAAYVPAKVNAAPKLSMQETCYQHYRRAFKACDVNSQSCHLDVADRWDLCEATGSWQD